MSEIRLLGNALRQRKSRKVMMERMISGIIYSGGAWKRSEMVWIKFKFQSNGKQLFRLLIWNTLKSRSRRCYKERKRKSSSVCRNTYWGSALFHKNHLLVSVSHAGRNNYSSPLESLYGWWQTLKASDSKFHSTPFKRKTFALSVISRLFPGYLSFCP